MRLASPLLLCSLLSCGEPVEVSRPDVVLITVDTLRADHLGSHGDPRDPTPVLDRLAARGVRFSRTYSTTGWTAPAVASLLTGHYPRSHGVRTGTWAPNQGRLLNQPRLPESLWTLPEVLGQAGYQTLGVVANWHLGRDQGFAQGFDTYLHFTHAGSDVIHATTRRALDELDPTRPRFVWAHFLDPHVPYQVRQPWFGPCLDPARSEGVAGPGVSLVFSPEELARTRTRDQRQVLASLRDQPELRAAYLATLEALYCSEVAAADEALGSLLRALEVDEDTLVIFASDHGEELGEHGSLGHYRTLYAELVRVPMVISWPTHLASGRVVDAPTSLVDLLPTVADLLDLPLEEAVQGHSLAPLLAPELGPWSPSPVYLEHTGRGASMQAVVADQWRLIRIEDEHGGYRVELYDDVPAELDVDDHSERRPDIATHLDEVLGAWLEAVPEAEPEHTEVVDDLDLTEQLRAMGYLE